MELSTIELKDLKSLIDLYNMGYGSSLRTLQAEAKSGKIKAIKPSRNWYSTEDWLQEAGYKRDFGRQTLKH